MTATSLEPKKGYVTARGFKMHYLEWGKKGRMLVTLNSMMLDAHSFDLFSRSMAKDSRVLAIDLLGHGDSDKPTAKVSIEEHAEIVREVVRKRKFSNIALIGHSIGGFVSVVYAVKHPDEVSGLILVDIAPRDPAERKGRPGMASPEVFNTREEAEAFFKQRFTTFTPEAMENRLKYGVEEMPDGKLRLKTSAATIAMLTEIVSFADLRPYVKLIKAPTLLIKGGESQSVSQNSIELLKKTLKNFSMVEVTGASHMVPQDHPKEFEEAVRHFLR